MVQVAEGVAVRHPLGLTIVSALLCYNFHSSTPSPASSHAARGSSSRRVGCVICLSTRCKLQDGPPARKPGLASNGTPVSRRVREKGVAVPMADSTRIILPFAIFCSARRMTGRQRAQAVRQNKDHTLLRGGGRPIIVERSDSVSGWGVEE